MRMRMRKLMYVQHMYDVYIIQFILQTVWMLFVIFSASIMLAPTRMTVITHCKTVIGHWSSFAPGGGGGGRGGLLNRARSARCLLHPAL